MYLFKWNAFKIKIENVLHFLAQIPQSHMGDMIIQPVILQLHKSQSLQNSLN